MDLYFGETASSLRRDSYKTPPSSSFLATTKLSCREGSWCTIHAESNYSYFLCTTFINVQTMKCLGAAGITAYDMIMRAQKPQLANAFSPDPPGGFRPYPRVYSGDSPLWTPPPFDMVVRVVRLVLNGWGEEWKGGGLFLSSPEFLSFQYHLSSQHSQIRGALGSRVNTHTQPLSPSSKDTIWGGVYICPKAKRCIWCQVSKKWRIVDEKTKMVWRFLVFSSWREEFTRFCLRGSGWVDMETTTSEQKFSCLLYFHQKHSIHFHWWLQRLIILNYS